MLIYLLYIQLVHLQRRLANFMAAASAISRYNDISYVAETYAMRYNSVAAADAPVLFVLHARFSMDSDISLDGSPISFPRHTSPVSSLPLPTVGRRAHCTLHAVKSPGREPRSN